MADAYFVKEVEGIKGAGVGIIDYEDISSGRNFGNFFERFPLRTSGNLDDFVEISNVCGSVLVDIFVDGKKCVGIEFLPICQIVQVAIGKGDMLPKDIFQIALDKINRVLVAGSSIYNHNSF